MHPEAEAEADHAASYYELQRPGLGREFREELENAVGRIVGNPQLYAMLFDDVRPCRLKRFPYTVYFADLDDKIWIVAVAHQRRRPGYWRQRQRP
jgi:toxin ParE1/3/4